MDTGQGQRKFSRVDFRMTASVEVGGLTLGGTVENLSLRGMFMATDHRPALGEAAEITIELTRPPDEKAGDGEAMRGAEFEPVIQVGGKVVRATGTGVAFCFDTIDSDSYVHLKNIVALNAGDPERTFGEMDSFLDGGQAPS
jgi:hypothetical protein